MPDKDDFVLIDENAITEPELRAFVAQLIEMTKADVQIHAQWRVYSDNPGVMVALDALFGSPAPVKVARAEKTPGAKRIYKTGSKGTGKGKSIQVSAKGIALHAAHQQQAITTAVIAEPQQIKAWEVHIIGVTGKSPDPVERITIDEKNRRLNMGLFEPGTLLRHPKAGFSQVTGAKGTRQGMTDIDTATAIKLLDA